MYTSLAQDQQQWQALMAEASQLSAEFLNTIDERAVATASQSLPAISLPDDGSGGLAALRKFKALYYPQLSASAGPRYLGFVTGGSTPAAVIGDWLTGSFDQNLSNYGESVAPEIELQTIQLLKDLFHIPQEFTGTFVTGATMSNFVGLAQGRQWIARQAGIDIATQGLYGLHPIKVVSACPHSSIYKSLSMLGMGKNQLANVATLPDREAININALTDYLEALKGEPCIVVGNAGTVNTVDFDDLKAIGSLKAKYNFWFHVDAAFGGFAACAPAYQHLLKGMEMADSITIDAHKWLNVPYDSAMQFSRHADIQLEVFQNSAAYLGEIGDKPDFVHLTPENSRRFRALPAWFSLMAYGRKGYREIVERDIAMADLLSGYIEKSSQFKLLAPTRLNVVCFTLQGLKREVDLELVQQFLETLTQAGKVFMTQTIYKGQPGIRAAFSNWRTNTQDVNITWESLVQTWHTLGEYAPSLKS
ncbi:pyridoxal-dependent decarboxylase [Fulvivirgaceae bacterium BMA12]|uniref:Pyridoxal-dependent decarboxylase n=1 Tax=Agaribacillus aureus TaxID=3051825 RepID=A0ABT8LC72_9BACT|nr:pyridoxal-dependent decarboxylase [Fulvivirgaceae bacterium BMA12]